MSAPRYQLPADAAEHARRAAADVPPMTVPQARRLAQLLSGGDAR